MQTTADDGLNKAAEKIIWNLIKGRRKRNLKKRIWFLFRTTERKTDYR